MTTTREESPALALAESVPDDAPARTASWGEASGLAVWGVFLLLLGFALYLTRSLLLPLVFAALANLVLRPVVSLLRRVGFPPAIGAALLVAALLGGAGYAVMTLAAPAAEWLERAPASLREVEQRLRFVREPIERVNDATEQVEKAAQISDDEATTVVIRRAGLGEILLNQTTSVLVGAVTAVILLYFLLARPDAMLQKLVSVAPRLRDKKRIVLVARRLEDDVSRYLLLISLINAGLGVAVGLALHVLGLPNAALWGVLAAASNFIPYLGALAMTLLVAAVGVLSFDEPARMFVPALAFLGLTTLEAYFVTPLLLGGRLRLSPVAVFLAVVVCSWFWGIAGALIAVPLLAALKIVASQVEPLAPVAHLLD